MLGFIGYDRRVFILNGPMSDTCRLERYCPICVFPVLKCVCYGKVSGILLFSLINVGHHRHTYINLIYEQ